MIARSEQRRRNFFTGAFSPPAGGLPFEIQPIAYDRAGLSPLVKLFDGDDEVLVVPGELAVPAGQEHLFEDGPVARILGEAGLVARPAPLDGPDDDTDAPRRYALTPADGSPPDPVAVTVAVLRVLGEPEATALSPVYGFLANQTMQPCDDPESTPEVRAPQGPHGDGVRLTVLDTGIDPRFWWPQSTPPDGDLDERRTRVAPLQDDQGRDHLGFAAGHGAFVAGIVRQLAPSSEVTVRRVADPDGCVAEPQLRTALLGLAAQDASPDIVVIPCAGYALRKGSYGTSGPREGEEREWFEPQELRAAIGSYLGRIRGAVVVCSAGNYGSSDPCYPAAFSQFDVRVVAVAALDGHGRRASFSNYGRWVNASALGVGLRSIYVEGQEHVLNDPDGTPESFALGACARWDGTSFSAPVVAGRIAEMLWALRRAGFGAATAAEAWSVVAALSSQAPDPGCGTMIDSTGVASG